MKKLVQSVLQRLLGFERYLFVFSWFKILTLKWDKKEGDFNFFLGQLSPDSVVLDIGANIGIMTGLLARRCPQGHIHAFEPIPENFRALQRIVRHLKSQNVTCYPLALGAEPGEVRMLMPVIQGVKMQGLSHIDHASIQGFEAEQRPYTVQQKRLDDLDFWKHGPVHAIKIDVENYEQFVLQGARNLLAAHRPLLYAELWDNENRRCCFELLQELGYEIRVLESGQLVSYHNSKGQHQNFFFTHPQKAS